MTNPTSRDADASRDANQPISTDDFFNHSPLKHSCYSLTLSEFDGGEAKVSNDALSKGFAKGYIRLQNDNVNALYFFKDNKALGLQLNLTKEQLEAYDEIIKEEKEPTPMSPQSMRAIHLLFGYVPEEKYFEQTSLKNYIQSLGLVDALPVHVLAFKIRPLLKTNPALFQYLTAEQRKALELDLRTAFYQLCTQYQMEETIRQHHNLSSYLTDIEHCAFLLRNLALADKKMKLEAHKQHARKSEEGLKAWYRDKIRLMEAFYLDFSAGKTIYFTRWMSELNTWRSYWSWAGQTMRVALNMMPKDFYNVQQTIDATTDPQESLRLLACILYYVRFLINFMLILKHTLKGPWMSEEEKQLVDKNGGTWNRFTERLAAEKFALINDLVWATNNLLNILWLAKPGLGPIGDVLALFLLAGDVYLTDWAGNEAEKKHRQEVQFYDNEIEQLKKKHDDADEEQRLITADQLARLENARNRYIDHWQRQSKGRKADMYYVVGITIGFMVMILPWAEMGAKASAEGLILGSTGFCFVLALLYSGYKSYMAVTKARDSRMSALQECYAILTAEGPLNKEDYIRYQDLFAQAIYQEKMAKYQLYVFIRSVIIQSIIPIAIFAGFTFSTFGIGLAAFAVVVAVSILTHYALEYFKPEEAALAEFDETQYNNFSKDMMAKSIAADIKLMRTQGVVGLFSSRTTPDVKPDIADPEAGLSENEAQPT